jgi:N-acetylmuramoyl-L-alanine amidase
MRHGSPDGSARRCRLPNLPKPDSFPKEPIEALFAFAALQAQKQQGRAVEELRKNADSLAAIVAAQRALAAAGFSLDESLSFLAEQALNITGSSGAVIALSDGGNIVCRAKAGLMGPRIGARLDPSSGLSGECFRSAEVLHCEDSETDPRVDREACQHLGIRSILVVPVRRQQETLGILEVFSGFAGIFAERDAQVLELLATQINEVLLAEDVHSAPPETSAVVQAAAAELGPTLETSVLLPLAEAALLDLAFPLDVALPTATEPGSVPHAEPHLFEHYAQPARHTNLRNYLLAAMLVVLVGAGATLGVRQWNRMRQPKPAPATPVIASPIEAPVAEGAVEVALAPTAVPGPAQITDVRYWSKDDLTSIALFLDGLVNYDSAALHDPDRIYFDLRQTTVAPDLDGGLKEKIIEVNDTLVRRVRLAHKDGVTRVVVDLTGSFEYSSVLSSTAPYRLMISVHAPRPGQAKAAPAPPAAANQQVAVSRSPTSTPVYAPRRLRIAIDPGHGGSELGAIGPKGTLEKDLVLHISKRLGNLLAARHDADVVYTRTADTFVPLETRTALANQVQADLFISIHANSSEDRGIRGIETFYMDVASTAHEHAVAERENATARKGPRQIAALDGDDQKDKIAESRKLATHIQQALYSSLTDGKRSLPNRGIKKAPFVVLTGVNMPSVLAEVAFLSSPTDEHALESAASREAVAQALCRGISQYLAGIKDRAATHRTTARGGK